MARLGRRRAVHTLLVLATTLVVPTLAFGQAKGGPGKGEKVDLEIKVIKVSTKKGEFEPELKALFKGMPVSFKSASTVDGYTKPAVGVGERVRFQIAETKEWVNVTVESIGAEGIRFAVAFGDKGEGFKATAKKRGGTAIAGPVAKRPDGSEILVAVRPK